MIAFRDLPLEHLLGFIEQQDLCNLALTNFELYEPCSKQLYKRLMIRTEGKLENKSTRKLDFQNSKFTVISGFKIRKDYKSDIMMIRARLYTLIQSLSINAKLITYIEELNIDSKFDDSIETLIKKLIRLLHNSKIRALRFSDNSTRRTYHNELLNGCFPNIETVSITNLNDLEALSKLEFLSNLYIGGRNNNKVDILSNLQLQGPSLNLLNRLESLHIESTSQFIAVMKCLLHSAKTTSLCLKLRSFTLHLTHESSIITSQLFASSLIDWACLKELVIYSGCIDEKCKYECVSNVRFPELMLRKVCFVESIPSTMATHKSGQLWELNVASILEDLETTRLSYLSLKYSFPDDGIIEDGVEGNYFQRLDYISEVLPKCIDNTGITLSLPNYLGVLSCYEQPMNNLFWNGCKCAHCEKYLSYLDEFMMTHRYYDTKLHKYKDLITCNICATIAQWLSQRVDHTLENNDLFVYKYPLKNTIWDFHQNTFSIPFRCTGHKNYIEYEFDEEVDYFVDAVEEIFPCIFDEKLFLGMCKSFGHYISAFMSRLCGLYRGNPESARLDNKDLNDGDMPEKFHRIFFNGFSYVIDKELNGTNFFENIYDI